MATPGRTAPGAAVSQLALPGRRAWLLNHLDTFAAGMAIALARVTWERRTVDASGSVRATGTGTLDGAVADAVALVVDWRGPAGAGGVLLLLSHLAPAAWSPSQARLFSGPRRVWSATCSTWRSAPCLVRRGGRRNAGLGAGGSGRSARRRCARPPDSTYGIFLWHGLVIAVYASRNPDAQFNLSLWRLLDLRRAHRGAALLAAVAPRPAADLGLRQPAGAGVRRRSCG
jgi:hypothetical protein